MRCELIWGAVSCRKLLFSLNFSFGDVSCCMVNRLQIKFGARMIFGRQAHEVGGFLVLGGKNACLRKLRHRLTHLRQHSFKLGALELAQLRVYIGRPRVRWMALSHGPIYRIFWNFE